MKPLALMLMMTVITTAIPSEIAAAQSNATLNEIATKYKACIKRELEASDNGDGIYDEAFFLEGKAHCDKIERLMIETAQAKSQSAQIRAEISALTDQLISGAKRELGLN